MCYLELRDPSFHLICEDHRLDLTLSNEETFIIEIFRFRDYKKDEPVWKGCQFIILGENPRLDEDILIEDFSYFQPPERVDTDDLAKFLK